MSWLSKVVKKVTGKRWSEIRGTVVQIGATVAGVVIGAITAGAGAPAGAALTTVLAAGAKGAAVGGAIGGTVGSAYAVPEAQNQAQKQADRAAAEAEAAANAGKDMNTGPESMATEDTAGNEAWRRRQAALAAGYGTGRGGTNITSNLGGGGGLG